MSDKIWKAVILTLAAIAFFGLPFSMLAFGSDFSTQKSPLYPYQSSVFLQEEFISSSTTVNNSIGTNGFSVVNGLGVAVGSEANRPGIVRRTTTSTSGTVAGMRLSGATDTLTDPSVPTSVLWIARLNTNDANTTVRIGALNGIAVNPPANGIYLEKLDGDTNWFCVTRAASVETRTDSGVAVNTSFNTFSYLRNSSGVAFSINSTPVCSTITTNIPTTFITPANQIINSAAADKSLDIDYFELHVTGIVR